MRLLEDKIESVPGEVTSEVDLVLRVFFGTKITEDANNALRDKCRHWKSKSMSVKERWHKCITTSLMVDNDRKDILVTTAAQQSSATRVPGSVFEWCADCDFSLGLPALETLGESSPSWLAMSPIAFREVPMAWLAACGAHPDFAAVHTSWLALLARPGQAVRPLGGVGHGIVLAVSQWGMVIWVMPAPSHLGSCVIARPGSLGKDSQLDFQLVKDLQGFRCLVPTIRSPRSMRIASGARGMLHGTEVE